MTPAANCTDFEGLAGAPGRLWALLVEREDGDDSPRPGEASDGVRRRREARVGGGDGGGALKVQSSAPR